MWKWASVGGEVVGRGRELKPGAADDPVEPLVPEHDGAAGNDRGQGARRGARVAAADLEDVREVRVEPERERRPRSRRHRSSADGAAGNRPPPRGRCRGTGGVCRAGPRPVAVADVRVGQVHRQKGVVLLDGGTEEQGSPRPSRRTRHDRNRVPSWKSPCSFMPTGRMSPWWSKTANVSPCLRTRSRSPAERSRRDNIIRVVLGLRRRSLRS